MYEQAESRTASWRVQVRSWMFFLCQKHTHSLTQTEIHLCTFPLARWRATTPISGKNNSIWFLAVETKTNMAAATPDRWRSESWKEIFVPRLLEWTRLLQTHVYTYIHTPSVSAPSRQQREMSGFGILFDGSASPAETPSHLLLLSILPDIVMQCNCTCCYLWTQETFSIFCGGCNGKGKVSVPIISCTNASLSFTGTNTNMQTHTDREKMTVLAKQERCKKTPVNTHQGWKYTDINRRRRK